MTAGIAISQSVSVDGGPYAVPPRAWAVDAAANEILVISHPDSYLRYRLHEVNEHGDVVRDQIETREGSVGRLILREGRPLTPLEDAAERERLNDLLASPGAYARHVKNDNAAKKMGTDVLKQMPDAMLWSYAPGQPQPPADGRPQAGAPLVVLDFKPNPAWKAADMYAEPLTGLRGRIWIDPASRRVVRLEGEVFQPVNLGWGMLAHIYPGGTVVLQQTNAGGQRWIAEHIVEQFDVRALLLKTYRQRLVFDYLDMHPVPAMDYREAIKVLLDTPLPTR